LFHRTNFYQKGLTLLGKTTFDRHIKVDVATAEHLIERKRARSKTTSRYPDNPEMRDVYEEELRRLGLRVVLLDEAQHMITSADGKQPKDQLNWIKSMATETGVLHVLIGTYDVLPFCNLDGQMARRGSEIHFARYHMEDEKDCQAFCNAFSSLLKQIPLTVDHGGLMQRWWYFFEGSIGCIGILKQWLVRALYRALREASPELTRAHLEKSVLPDAKWERMRADARSGEAEFQYADAQNSYLSDLASLPAFVPGQSAPPQEPQPQPESQEGNGTGKQETRKRKSRPGEPAPRRDQVGIADGEPSHCSFSGPIELEAVRWLESTVQEVQCPTCGSVSKAKLKRSSVVITSHPPRMARPVRNVTRWAEQGAAWVLVQKKE
jgi:Bacterial TniB protein